MDFKTYPVIVFVEGEMFTQGNPGKYPAEDLAAEGLVIVSVHYRLNIFGMFDIKRGEPRYMNYDNDVLILSCPFSRFLVT